VQDTGQEPDEFDAQVVSAFSEAFNNVAMHGYKGLPPGDVDIEIEANADGILIRIADMGNTYDFLSIPVPPLDKLPESGMGVYIIRSFMDSVTYEAGEPPRTPNVLSLYKRKNNGALSPLTSESGPLDGNEPSP
jgi:serine/threonine-protein kinase RsbW